MREVERENPRLDGVLPKTYHLLASALLKDLLRTVSEVRAGREEDSFGRIYEYFLAEFARTEGQRGGEFYTPGSIVRLLVEVLEPFHGRILDPACGSGGMFVQSARFVSSHRMNPASELSIHGQEKVPATANLCRMNLAVHGLDGDIREGISYYDDPHHAAGTFDFVLANPPFNVNGVDKARIMADAGLRGLYPFGLPRTDNANYLWIQLFYAALNSRGRAGFVMLNSASDARGSDGDVRRRLIEERAVDAVVAVGPNMFYTVTLPVTLWFLDRGRKASPRRDTVLFVDARRIYQQVDRVHRCWTPAQTSFIANVVRVYRGEDADFTHDAGEARARLEAVFGTALTFADVPGLCKAAPIDEIERHGWSLNPARYVGHAPGPAVTGTDYTTRLRALREELAGLNADAHRLERAIMRRVGEMLDK